MNSQITHELAKELLNLLQRIDNGYQPSRTELNHLSKIRIVDFSGLELNEIPESIEKLFCLTSLDISINQLTTLPVNLWKLSNLTELNISNNNLTSLSEDIGRLSQLTKLDISVNELKALPANICKLLHLTKLNASNNELSNLSESLGELSNLITLDISVNHLTHLFAGISKLSQLKQLNISDNQLTSLSVDISGLSQLTELHMSNNWLTSLPGSIGELSNLTKLHICGNQLASLPNSISDLSKLEFLDISNNQFASLPESLTELYQLKYLDVFANAIAFLPKSIAALHELIYLNISNNKLHFLPENIGELSSMMNLNVSRNSLASLPESTKNLSQLMCLNVSHNKLSFLPKNIGNLSQLSSLDVSHNCFASFPESISKFSLLKCLNISNNQLASLSTGISKLSHMENLDLSGNWLINLPENIGELFQLTILDISNNRLTNLPVGICELSRLTKLDIKSNKLTNLPEDIGKLSQLTELDISVNQLTSLPKSISGLSQLNALRLSDNLWNIIPDWLGDMPKLNELDLANLQLVKLPRSLLKLNIPFLSIDFPLYRAKEGRSGFINVKGTELSIQPISLFDQSRDNSYQFKESRKLIENYFDTSKVPIREAKVIFLGDGKVGKTYTIQRLLHNCRKGKYLTKETHGILIEDLYTEQTGEPYKVRIWDFGGQDIMHEMHRCFLTDRTCYVIMVDTRIDKQTGRARYWLRTVQSITPKSPILLLVNEISGGKNRDLDYKSLKQDFPNLVGAEYCSSMDASDEEFRQKVENTIFKQALNLDSCKMEFPKSWEKVRQSLLNLHDNINFEQKNVYYISRQMFHTLCDQYGVPMDKGLRAWLLTWFNDLGVCFSYHLGENGQEQSRDYKILDPMWLTSAVYKIIWEKEQNDDGLISLSEIYRILEKPGSDAMKKDGIPCLKNVSYSKEECGYILDIMRMFRISYPADKYTEFLPTLCKPDSKLEPTPRRWNQHAAFKFSYTFLPENVLHRLMIYCYANLRTGKRWRKGFWLECEPQGLSAVIRVITQDSEENELQIDVYAQKEQYEAWTWLQPLYQKVTEINDSLSLNAEIFLLAENECERTWFALDSIWYWKNQKGTAMQGTKSYFSIQTLMNLIYGKYLLEEEKKQIILQNGYHTQIAPGMSAENFDIETTEFTRIDLSEPLENQIESTWLTEIKRNNHLLLQNINATKENTAALLENTLTTQQSNDLLVAIRDGNAMLPQNVMEALVDAFQNSDEPVLQICGKRMTKHSQNGRWKLFRDFLGDAANLATVIPVLIQVGKEYGPYLLNLLKHVSPMPLI